jgi:ribonuclease E
LLRLWDDIREHTLKSVAPALIYEEASLIKRAIRDVYSRDIDEIHVEGEEGYRLAKDFMRMLTPSHARKVQLYRDPAMPLFHKYQVEAQLDAMHSPVVQLKSGGYLVINQAEALVAIDVNSGRSTKERHIEETALKTNIEAADEVARQLRLRDLAGLIVIDFIDMEETRNNHAVERRLKDAMRFDRARIQLGRISPFGLLELSRQRLRPSLMESSFLPCPHCEGTGMVRSVESASMHVLRAIEEEGVRRRSSEITVTVHSDIALYILNQKRGELGLIEARYGFKVFLQTDSTLVPPALRMERIKSDVPIEIPTALPAPIDEDPRDSEVEDEAVTEDGEEQAATAAERGTDAKDDGGEDGRRRRRRRRRRGRRDELPGGAGDGEQPSEARADNGAEPASDSDGGNAENADGAPTDVATEMLDGQAVPRRRRGKRGGRRRQRRPGEQQGDMLDIGGDAEPAPPEPSATHQDLALLPTQAEAAPLPTPKPKRSRKKVASAAPIADEVQEAVQPIAEAAPVKPRRVRRAKPTATIEADPSSQPVATLAPVTAPQPAAGPQLSAEPTTLPVAPSSPGDQPARKGWWNRFM